MDELETTLNELAVDDDWIRPIVETATELSSHLSGVENPVQAIYINRTGLEISHFSIQEWVIPELTRVHSGAWPLVLDLFEDGVIAREAVVSVRAELLGLGKTPEELSSFADEAVADGFILEETPALFD